jgi:hypothetical protein
VSEAEEELVMPSWLTQAAEAEVEDVAPEADTETGMPAWLTGLAAASVTAAVVTPEAEAVETPPWLAELSETPTAEGEPAAPVEGVEAEVQRLSPWLAHLTTDELRMPAALAQPVEAEEVAQAAEEAPSEPTELSEAPSTEEVSEAEEELVMPSWLSELPEVPATEPASVEPASEAETPPWLAELSETPTAEGEPAAPVEVSPTEEVSEAEVEDVAPEADTETGMPAWLTGLAAASVAAAAVTPEAEQETLPGSMELPEAPPTQAEAVETPPWLAELTETPTAEVEPAAPAERIEAEEEELPPWLADLSDEELKMPSWLTGTPEAASVETSLIEAPVEESQVSAELEAPVEQAEVASEVMMAGVAAAPPVEAEPTGTEAPPDVLATTPSVEQEESLDFLAGEEPKTAQPAEPPTATSEVGELPDIEPEAPDWLKEIGDSPAPTSGKTESQAEAPDMLIGAAATTAAAAALTETPLTPVGRMSDWLRNLKPTEETLETEDTAGASESTGVLTGLTPLLPIERMATAVPPLAPQVTATTAQADVVQEAAHHFFAIATQAPQPAVLPESLTQREQLTGTIVRATLYLLFMLLLALPLVRGWQKVVDPATDRKVPWTEPAGGLSEVLDKQRRELVSEQLGVIDLQQPSSVALVSFDYTTATQGEMEPLAEDVISRLLGQGMRLISVSLEPEGAALAQRTLDRLLAERDEAYGVNMVNLGYVPGQVAGVRELLTGRKQLSAISDFQEGLTFAAPERATWSDVNNLGQVDIIVTLADNPVAARWWIEQMATAVPADDGERYLLAATSAMADPFLRPYLESQQLDGLLSGVNGAAAIEAGRQNFGPARQMLDSQSMAHLLIVILIALGTMVGWMPVAEKNG